jgi:RNA polymerase sigma factor (TIGR02999 family)
MDDLRSTATQLLLRASAGDTSADAAFEPLLYDQLRAIARNLLRRERANHTLQPTALVHEAYLAMVDDAPAGADREAMRSRFLGFAATAMRRILIQHARTRGAQKRGGGRARVELDDVADALPCEGETLLDLDEALGKLAAINAELAKLAELRLFAGLSVRELAPVLGMSLTTAKDQWALARAWLGRLLGDRARAAEG